MQRFILILLLLALSSGCVSTEHRINTERRRYLLNPAFPRYSYDGKELKVGEPYRFLFRNDPGFGDYLLSILPTTSDVRIAYAALIFFSSKAPDHSKFEQAVSMIRQKTLDQEVDVGGGDVLMMVPLSGAIEEIRQRNGWRDQRTQ